MRSRTLLNLVLMVAVGGLLALLWLNPGEEVSAKSITTLIPEKITHIEIDFPDAPTLKLAHKNDHWRITEPVKARAENSDVRSILEIAARTANRSYPAAEMDLGKVGLDPPKQVLSLDGVQISLGATDALQHNRYAKVGDQVYLIDSPIDSAIDADYAELVARELLPLDSQITQLKLPKAHLSPSDAGGWKVTPSSADEGADAAQFTVDAWQRARALWIKLADVDKTSQGEIQVVTQAGDTYFFELISREPQLVLRAPDIGVDYFLAENQAEPLIDMRHPQTETSDSLKTMSDVELSPADSD